MSFLSPGYTSQQKNQINLLNKQGGTQFGEAGNIYGQIDPALQAILANPGYTPQQVSDLTTGALQPISSIYSSGAANLGRLAGASRNSAGLVSGQDAMARSALQALGPANANLQANIANRPRQQTFEALSGLQSLYNPTISSGENLYGQATNVANNPASPSVFSDILGGVGTAAGAALGVEGGLGMLGGKRFGGPVKKKRPVIVGEEGPEIYTPKSNGRITPNPRTLAEENIYGG